MISHTHIALQHWTTSHSSPPSLYGPLCPHFRQHMHTMALDITHEHAHEMALQETPDEKLISLLTHWPWHIVTGMIQITEPATPMSNSQTPSTSSRAGCAGKDKIDSSPPCGQHSPDSALCGMHTMQSLRCLPISPDLRALLLSLPLCKSELVVDLHKHGKKLLWLICSRRKSSTAPAQCAWQTFCQTFHLSPTIDRTGLHRGS